MRVSKLLSLRKLAIRATLVCVIGFALFSVLFSFAPRGHGAPQDARPSNSQGQAKAAAASAAPATNTPPMTVSDVEAFLDGLVPLQIKREDIAGVVVVVVKDGKVFFARGYGYADAEKKTPVSADETLFRIGSISKLFTWTSVMQLVEQGKLDLDRDVNGYLDFKIPATFGKPVTLRNLMTHTPGFEEAIKDLFVGETSRLQPLGVYLSTHVPHQIFPPGAIPAYSNYGAALAGYIVQRVSGRPFDDYVEENIFKPLSMSHTTFRQPLPNSLEPLMSSGYFKASQGSRPFELVNPEPAGSVASSGVDMAKFMLAHLQDGQLGDIHILRSDTARLMHSRQFGTDPRMNGMCLGFYEENRNGHRIIGHGGDTQYFHSDLHLVLDSGVGFFVSYNSLGKGEISPRTALWEKFLDRYFPYTPPPATTAASATEDARMVGGSYINSRRSDTTLLKLFSLLGELTVSPKSDGTIEVDQLKGLNGQPIRWREIGPLLYRDANGQDQILFKRDGTGRLVLSVPFPVFVFQRAAGPENGRFILVVLVACLVVLALTLLLWPVAALVRRHYGQKLNLSVSENRLRILVRLICAFDLLFVLGWVIILSSAQKHIAMLTSASDGWFHLLQVIGLIGAMGTLLLLYNAVRSWSRKDSWVWGKLFDAVIALASLGFVWIVITCNLLHFGLHY